MVMMGRSKRKGLYPYMKFTDFWDFFEPLVHMQPPLLSRLFNDPGPLPPPTADII